MLRDAGPIWAALALERCCSTPTYHARGLNTEAQEGPRAKKETRNCTKAYGRRRECLRHCFGPRSAVSVRTKRASGVEVGWIWGRFVGKCNNASGWCGAQAGHDPARGRFGAGLGSSWGRFGIDFGAHQR